MTRYAGRVRAMVLVVTVLLAGSLGASAVQPASTTVDAGLGLAVDRTSVAVTLGSQAVVAVTVSQPGSVLGPVRLSVSGVPVFDANGEKIGVIECVMIEKVSGRVSFAVLSFGGFLGIGDEHYPLPWPALKYNVELGGYQIMIPVEKLKAGGKTDLKIEGLPHCDWVLVDAGDVIVHIFRPEVRSFYNLEKLWSPDAPRELAAL